MNLRDRYMQDEEREDDARNWRNARPGLDLPSRVTTPEPRPRVSIDAWRTSPAVVREKQRSFVAGFVWAMAIYGVASLVLVIGFHCLGVHAP